MDPTLCASSMSTQCGLEGVCHLGMSSSFLWTYLPDGFLQEGHEFEELLVTPVHEPALNGDAVVQLIAKRLRGIVDDDRLGEITAQDGQVLNIVPIDTNTVLTEQAMSEGREHRNEQHICIIKSLP